MEFQPKNSTTARKAGNDMKKNASIAKMGDSPAAWQKADKGLGFNGQDNGSEQRAKASKYGYNQHSGTANNDSGFGQPQMPNRKGNHGDLGSKRVPPATAAASKNPVQSGARAWAPAAGQNFRGNPDMIQDRQGYNRVGNKD